MSKEEIVDRLQRLPRKIGLRRLPNITVQPFADSLPPPPLPPIQNPEQFTGFVFLDEVGAIWQIDGVNDEGYGEAVVYARIGQTRAGSVESTLVDDFVKRLSPECQHLVPSWVWRSKHSFCSTAPPHADQQQGAAEVARQ